MPSVSYLVFTNVYLAQRWALSRFYSSLGLPIAIVGARPLLCDLPVVLLQSESFFLEIFAIWNGGIAIYGGLIVMQLSSIGFRNVMPLAVLIFLILQHFML